MKVLGKKYYIVTTCKVFSYLGNKHLTPPLIPNEKQLILLFDLYDFCTSFLYTVWIFLSHNTKYKFICLQHKVVCSCTSKRRLTDDYFHDPLHHCQVR